MRGNFLRASTVPVGGGGAGAWLIGGKYARQTGTDVCAYSVHIDGFNDIFLTTTLAHPSKYA